MHNRSGKLVQAFRQHRAAGDPGLRRIGERGRGFGDLGPIARQPDHGVVLGNKRPPCLHGIADLEQREEQSCVGLVGCRFGRRGLFQRGDLAGEIRSGGRQLLDLLAQLSELFRGRFRLCFQRGDPLVELVQLGSCLVCVLLRLVAGALQGGDPGFQLLYGGSRLCRSLLLLGLFRLDPSDATALLVERGALLRGGLPRLLAGGF